MNEQVAQSFPFPAERRLSEFEDISKKWTMPIRDWKAALTRFTTQFDDRMNSL